MCAELSCDVIHSFIHPSAIHHIINPPIPLTSDHSLYVHHDNAAHTHTRQSARQDSRTDRQRTNFIVGTAGCGQMNESMNTQAGRQVQLESCAGEWVGDRGTSIHRGDRPSIHPSLSPSSNSAWQCIGVSSKQASKQETSHSPAPAPTGMAQILVRTCKCVDRIDDASMHSLDGPSMSLACLSCLPFSLQGSLPSLPPSLPPRPLVCMCV